MKMDLGCRFLYSACWCRMKSTRNWIALGLIPGSEEPACHKSFHDGVVCDRHCVS